eukprot:m.657642 g.657642  ORF g.657642 m.657642 type:complete len:403 (+) comp58437_c0_seq2:3864-5072(+)
MKNVLSSEMILCAVIPSITACDFSKASRTSSSFRESLLRCISPVNCCWEKSVEVVVRPNSRFLVDVFMRCLMSRIASCWISSGSALKSAESTSMSAESRTNTPVLVLCLCRLSGDCCNELAEVVVPAWCPVVSMSPSSSSSSSLFSYCGSKSARSKPFSVGSQSSDGAGSSNMSFVLPEPETGRESFFGRVDSALEVAGVAVELDAAGAGVIICRSPSDEGSSSPAFSFSSSSNNWCRRWFSRSCWLVAARRASDRSRCWRLSAWKVAHLSLPKLPNAPQRRQKKDKLERRSMHSTCRSHKSAMLERRGWAVEDKDRPDVLEEQRADPIQHARDVRVGRADSLGHLVDCERRVDSQPGGMWWRRIGSAAGHHAPQPRHAHPARSGCQWKSGSAAACCLLACC